MKAHTQKFLQRRKFFMVLPLLVLPFLIMIFWALGGGQGLPAHAMSKEKAGLNLNLPDAHFDDREIWDKLSLYEKAESDSAKFEEARESDPYFDLISFKAAQPNPSVEEKQNNLIHAFPQKDRSTVDPHEEKVNQKLDQLYREINKASVKATVPAKGIPVSPGTDKELSSDIDRLESMMELMNENQQADPEMQQIESMLEKILDIQHPERMEEKLKERNQRKSNNAFAVEVASDQDDISMLDTRIGSSASLNDSSILFSVDEKIQNAFYNLNDEILKEPLTGNAIEAVIHDTQELVAGATVKIRLLNDVYINDQLFSKDQFVYGICAINGERLTITINSIRNDNSLLPVSLSVYDLDGLEGIYIPGAIMRDAAKQSSDDAIQSVQLTTLDPSLEAQAASVGVEAAKGLFGKKSKLLKVTVKAGYKILLLDTKA